MIPRASCSRKIINNSHICPRGEMLIFYSSRLPAHHNIQGYLPQSCFPVKACLLFPPPPECFLLLLCVLFDLCAFSAHTSSTACRQTVLCCLFALSEGCRRKVCRSDKPPPPPPSSCHPNHFFILWLILCSSLS